MPGPGVTGGPLAKRKTSQVRGPAFPARGRQGPVTAPVTRNPSQVAPVGPCRALSAGTRQGTTGAYTCLHLPTGDSSPTGTGTRDVGRCRLM